MLYVFDPFSSIVVVFYLYFEILNITGVFLATTNMYKPISAGNAAKHPESGTMQTTSGHGRLPSGSIRTDRDCQVCFSLKLNFLF